MQQLHSASISRKGIHPPLARSFSGMAGVTAFGGPRLVIFLAVVTRRIFMLSVNDGRLYRCHSSGASLVGARPARRPGSTLATATMAQWLRKDDEGPPAELLDFDPDDWVLGARSNPARLEMALDRWYETRWEWVMVDPHKRAIDGDDVVAILFEDER